MPHADILTDEHVYVESHCPTSFVATGVQLTSSLEHPPCPSCRTHLRCTKINTSRYQLSEPAAGRYWGTGVSSDSQRVWSTRSELPLSVRYGIGRRTYRNWDVDGCIGKPIGSLLVEYGFTRCERFRFSELRYTGLPGDPAAGAPVTMFPSCSKLLDPFDPTGGCVLKAD
jgi:hypothetical protein